MEVRTLQDDRIWVNPSPASKGGLTEIGYRGLLAKSGADKVYLHYGTDGWKNPRTVPMSKRPDGSFATQIMADAERSLEFCFKDSADHWDNNNGLNWYVPVHKK
ncbi:MAG TPA: carbohydrate-binding protein [Firmicutes bacterium]|nr:carbohydrate-binding protein [Candidatus Fermentithermobacillaceae bacterium]